jgi:hypothetical protein
MVMPLAMDTANASIARPKAIRMIVKASTGYTIGSQWWCLGDIGFFGQLEEFVECLF